MKVDKYLTIAGIAGALLIHPMVGVAYDSAAVNGGSQIRHNDPVITSEQSPGRRENDATGPFDMAAVDYCYQGSSVDPASGEVIDFFVLCPEDGAEQEMDLA